ncbi:LysR family cys regulon transcriptional activator [Nitrosomonas nitrosa]|jgi:LysR family cys regulon transcriptional activator|uniref:DNA-binding transcriptional dual regulator, O-acetyl-L-serine-binding n=1 Tax=Nitrosomonas nitrosa TaxID=52442 RepID=A0A1I4MZT2_9PROT|nr:HTH-type transcriptional regulator CysB [Nitrosomonas nitrosa]MCO6433872.1 HTH-type transcriptional regulator CysB [Nitrosomonas nitrosa]PTQ90579.1 LysR family cys regulon transcriptional activator [Nitrosomonas nitrosa]CAE6490092.1 DNA-binding transcriptional dual regulator, O-acetyl-L-serine-binding [Nitrosomonas nitrosa]SFM08470.1 LysR family transcriptional regulator, cys regulon transcriptional activator [Nitrosomonas nitrosa]
MRLQQLRYLSEIVRQNLNLSKAAERLHTSQPGISRQIQLLEEELGVTIFVRNGKRIVKLTPPGQAIIGIAEKMLKDAENLKQIGLEFSDSASGELIIATTHTQARYALPPIIKRFTERYPKVKLILRQGSPTQISELVSSGEANLAIATEAIELFEELVMLPCYQWNRCIIVPPKHPLLRQQPVTLEAIALYPIITYDFAFTGRSKINQAFESKKLTPNVVLTAIDADVIKTYVELGLGIGILAKMAFDPHRDKHLRAIDASHLFEASMTRIGISRNSYIRSYVYDFIEMFAPHLDQATVKAAMKSKHPRSSKNALE